MSATDSRTHFAQFQPNDLASRTICRFDPGLAARPSDQFEEGELHSGDGSMSGWNDGASGGKGGAASSGGDSWGVGATSGGGDWNAGSGAATGGFEGGAGGTTTSTNGFGAGGAANGEGGSRDLITCRVCNQEGHIARECPDKPEGFGTCFNCGQEGHNKSDCPNPRIFTGECRICKEKGHPAAECSSKPPTVCKNCQQEGHFTGECKENRKFDRESLPVMTPDEAWNLVEQADKDKDLEDFRKAIQIYAKSWPDVTYRQIEETMRDANMETYLVATEKALPVTQTFINLQGELDKKYQVGYYFSDQPKRQRQGDAWPKSKEENLDRLDDAGLPFQRGIPYCIRCKELGHSSNKCPEAPIESEAVKIMCVNCNEEGHRARDCPGARQTKRGPMTCRNCGQEGHKGNECTEPVNMANITCRKCEETGHFARECPNELCNNCNKPGHRSKECDEPRNPSTIICRNCDATGHFSKECPKPRDYSRVGCQNCGEKGHTKVRCKKAPAGAADNVDGGVPVSGADGWGPGGGDPVVGDTWGAAPEAAPVAGTWSIAGAAW